MPFSLLLHWFQRSIIRRSPCALVSLLLHWFQMSIIRRSLCALVSLLLHWFQMSIIRRSPCAIDGKLLSQNGLKKSQSRRRKRAGGGGHVDKNSKVTRPRLLCVPTALKYLREKCWLRTNRSAKVAGLFALILTVIYCLTAASLFSILPPVAKMVRRR